MESFSQQFAQHEPSPDVLGRELHQLPGCLDRDVVVANATCDVQDALPVQRIAGIDRGGLFEARDDVAESPLLESQRGGGQCGAQGRTPCVARLVRVPGERSAPRSIRSRTDIFGPEPARCGPQSRKQDVPSFYSRHDRRSAIARRGFYRRCGVSRRCMHRDRERCRASRLLRQGVWPQGVGPEHQRSGAGHSGSGAVASAAAPATVDPAEKATREFGLSEEGKRALEENKSGRSNRRA